MGGQVVVDTVVQPLTLFWMSSKTLDEREETSLSDFPDLVFNAAAANVGWQHKPIVASGQCKQADEAEVEVFKNTIAVWPHHAQCSEAGRPSAQCQVNGERG